MTPLAFACALLHPASSPKVPQLDIRVVFSETANLTYQLDAVSGTLGHIDPADYRELWKREFQKSPADEQMIKVWGEVKKRYFTSAILAAPDMPFEAADRSVTLSEKLRMASLRADSQDRFMEDASLLMVPADAAKLGEVLRYFTPRFHTWWQREAAKRGKEFVQKVDRLMRSGPIQAEIERFRSFYSPSLPEGSRVYFSLIYRPDLVKAPTNGQQIGNVGLAEFLPKETPEKRLDVVLHEFCHYLYNSRSDADTLAFQQRFFDSGDPAAKPSYNLLNEGMATALGNGIIGRRFKPAAGWSDFLARPLSLYNNSSIDRAGKRLLTLMDRWLSAGRTIDDPTFVPEYIAAMKETFGKEITSPSLYLGEAYILVDDKFGIEFARTARRDLHVAGAYMSVTNVIDDAVLEDYVRQPGLSALFVVSTPQLKSLEERKVLTHAEAEAIRGEVARSKTALFCHSRSPHAYTFIIVSDSYDGARARLAELARLTQIFTGIAR